MHACMYVDNMDVRERKIYNAELLHSTFSRVRIGFFLRVVMTVLDMLAMSNERFQLIGRPPIILWVVDLSIHRLVEPNTLQGSCVAALSQAPVRSEQRCSVTTHIKNIVKSHLNYQPLYVSV